MQTAFMSHSVEFMSYSAAFMSHSVVFSSYLQFFIFYMHIMKFLLLPAFSRQTKKHKHIRRRVKHCITCKCTHCICYYTPRCYYCCRCQFSYSLKLAHKHCNKRSQIQQQSRNSKKYHMLYIFIS